MFNIIKIGMLRAENKRLKEELEQKEMTIQYLNALGSKKTKEIMSLRRKIALMGIANDVSFPNTEEVPEQISIQNILEH